MNNNKTLKIKELIDYLNQVNPDANIYIVDPKGSQHTISLNCFGWSNETGSEDNNLTKENCKSFSIYYNGGCEA